MIEGHDLGPGCEETLLKENVELKAQIVALSTENKSLLMK